MIRQQLTQRQQQKLSPLQIQQIKLLELNGMEIEDRITKELEENPALEEVPDLLPDGEGDAAPESDTLTPEEVALGDYRTEDDIPDYKLLQSSYSKENQRDNIPHSEAESFQDYLLNQLYLKHLSEEEVKIGEYLIGNIDEDGYMRRELSAISDDLAFQYGLEVGVEEIEKVLRIIWEMDPPGIGAATLQECLLLQLKRREDSNPQRLAITILEDYFDTFSKKQYDKIAKGLAVGEDDLKEAVRLITQLDPRPGRAWESSFESKMAQITPDFYVEALNGELSFSMNDQYIPELQVNPEYKEMLNNYSKKDKSASGREAFSFIRQKIDSAQWFIDAVKQRNTTLRRTMLAIMAIQHDFFLTGDESDLRPMILKDVAERCGYDISTISRVSASKYVQTNFGVYPLKYFFSEGFVNEDGEEISTREIKAILKKCIEEEDKNKPLTDDALGKELKKRGYDIARRTVAKYREQMSIPIARFRKTI